MTGRNRHTTSRMRDGIRGNAIQSSVLERTKNHGKNRKADFWRRNCSRELHSTGVGGAQEQAIHSSEWVCCSKPPRKRCSRPGIAFEL
jgi:hypothetical protein